VKAGGVDSRTAAREKSRAKKKTKRRSGTETAAQVAELASIVGNEPADTEFKNRRWNEKQKALARRREILSIEVFERLNLKLEKEEAEEGAEEQGEGEAVEDPVEDSTTPLPQELQATLSNSENEEPADSAEGQTEATAPPEPFSRVQKTMDAALNTDAALLTHDRVKLAHECADVQERQATNRKLNADAEVVEQRAAKMQAEAGKASAEAQQAQAGADSEPTRQKIKRADEVVALVMRVLVTVYAMSIVLAGFLINPLLVPSGAAVAGGAYGIKYWWSGRRRRDGQDHEDGRGRLD